uniref:Uncharacterized protein n=1 Tax=Cacopsylla melanoneura TaxID=428564 RepID=A0A8D8Y8T8_9HEMI
MSGRIFYLNGRSSEMKCQIFPSLAITPNAVLGLMHFQVYNSIPNVDEKNCSFQYELNGKWKMIIIPEGTYELSNIDEYLKSNLGQDNISIIANPNTLKCIFW